VSFILLDKYRTEEPKEAKPLKITSSSLY